MIGTVCLKKKKNIKSVLITCTCKKISSDIFVVSVVCGLFVRYDSVLSAFSQSVGVGTAIAPSSLLC